MTADVSVNARARKKSPTTPCRKASGTNTTTVVNVVPMTAGARSSAPRADAVSASAPRVAMARDGLDHDDGVVHDEADGDRHSAQRHEVERLVREAHHDEADGQRDGHRRRRHQPRAQIAQKERDDEGAEQDAEDDGVAHAGHRLANQARLVVHRLDGHPGGSEGRSAATAATARSTTSGVLAPGSRATLIPTVSPRGPPMRTRRSLVALGDLRDRTDRDGDAGGGGQDGEVANVGEALRLRVADDRDELPIAIHAADGAEADGGADPVGDIGGGQVEGRRRFGVQDDLDTPAPRRRAPRCGRCRGRWPARVERRTRPARAARADRSPQRR